MRRFRNYSDTSKRRSKDLHVGIFLYIALGNAKFLGYYYNDSDSPNELFFLKKETMTLYTVQYN